MSVDLMIDFLDELFDGLKVEDRRDEQRSADVFHIEVDSGIEMILALSDVAKAQHSQADIEKTIAAAAKPLLESNHNALVLVDADLNVSLA